LHSNLLMAVSLASMIMLMNDDAATSFMLYDGVFSGEGRGVAVMRLTFCAVAALILVTIIVAAACVRRLLLSV